MDDADRAETQIENVITDALQRIRLKPSLIPAGVCHYCGEPLDNPNYIFCDSECSMDFHKQQNIRKITGKQHVL